MTDPRILILANHIDQVGGVERVVHLLASAFAERDHDVELLGMSPTTEEAKLDVGYRPYRSGFVSSLPFPLLLSRGKDNRVTDKDISDRKLVRETLRKETAASLRGALEPYMNSNHIVICTQLYAMERVFDALPDIESRRSLRIIGQYHNSHRAATTTNDMNRAKRVYMDVDKLLLLTSTDADQFRRHGFNNTGSIVNPLSFFPKSVDSERENTVVVLARHHSSKAVDQALRAWALIAPSFPTWRLELHGDGPETPMLEKLILELNIGASVEIMGASRDVEKVLLRSKLNVLCSQYEGLPMVLTEALACGVPSVAYNCSPGIPEIIDHEKTGLIVRRNDYSGLAQALKRLMTNEEERIRFSVAARESARRFEAKTVVSEWYEIFDDVLR